MSRLFGPIRKTGYVVPDIRAAMDHWVRVLGVGPWFYFDRVKVDWFRHRDERGRFSYFDTELHPGTVIELSDISGPKGWFFEHVVKQAAVNWDGAEPIREM